MSNRITTDLLEFIKKSPSCFHAVQTTKDILIAHGFTELTEDQTWDLKAGCDYFVTRNGSSIIAFSIPETTLLQNGFRIIASHSDSPSFKIKENPEMAVEDHYIKLNVERYGGMPCAPWFDRPLSVAGRVIVKENGAYRAKLIDADRDLLLIPNLAIHMNRDANSGYSYNAQKDLLPLYGDISAYRAKLIDADRDLLLIPNLAIHMNRDANSGYSYNAQKDLLPLYGDISAKDTFLDTIAKYADVKKEDILSHDLFLYNRQEGTLWGANEEFLSAPRLDDLQCACASLYGLLSAERKDAVAVHCVLDNEEVGSTTKQGAASSFLRDTLYRICTVFGMDTQDYFIALSKSYMISADNAHAVHPNHTDKADPVNRPYLNEGIVIKYNANQKYCTDGISAAMFKDICKQADVPYQTFTNRSDMPGGSTLGNISNTQVALNTVDIGLPQLAMHSPYETAGVKDTEYLVKAAKEFFA